MKLFINSNEFIVEKAQTQEQRAKGMMYREVMPKNFGMLFVFEQEQYQSFWMKNTLIHLDIIYVDKYKSIIDIYHNVEPCKVEDCPSYQSSQPAQYVLELKGGTCKKLNINKGDKLIF